MSRIKIKNFGPIKTGLKTNNGWLDIKRTTVFIGNQGSGKSTMAKLISTFTWIEKALTRGDFNKSHFTTAKFLSTYCRYQNIHNYFHPGKKASIEYEGDSYHFTYKNNKLTISESMASTKKYSLPQILYVPSERNIVSIKRQSRFARFNIDALFDFSIEVENAQNSINGTQKLPINDSRISYDKRSKTTSIIGKDYQVRLTEASSGFQSAVPLYITAKYNAEKVNSENRTEMSSKELNNYRSWVASIWRNKKMSDDEKRIALSALSERIRKTSFINIVEEPEQNLYPQSQKDLLFSLLELVNYNPGNCLIMSTHSPYLIHYLTLAIKAKELYTKYSGDHNNPKELEKLYKIVPEAAAINTKDVVIYEFDTNGSIKRLSKSSGLPSDNNFLNNALEANNEFFIKLLEIEGL